MIFICRNTRNKQPESCLFSVLKTDYLTFLTTMTPAAAIAKITPRAMKPASPVSGISDEVSSEDSSAGAA